MSVSLFFEIIDKEISIKENFDQKKLKQDLSELLTALVKRPWEGVSIQHELINLCDRVSENYKDHGLIRKISKIKGFLDLIKSSPIESYLKGIEEEHVDVEELISNLDGLGIQTTADRMALMQEIISQGKIRERNCYLYLVRHFDTIFPFEGISTQRMSLGMDLAKNAILSYKGEMGSLEAKIARRTVLGKWEALGLQGKERIELLEQIISQGEKGAASHIIKELDDWVGSVPEAERVDLIKWIIRKKQLGEGIAAAITDRLHGLGLRELSWESKLAVFAEIVISLEECAEGQEVKQKLKASWENSGEAASFISLLTRGSEPVDSSEISCLEEMAKKTKGPVDIVLKPLFTAVKETKRWQDFQLAVYALGLLADSPAHWEDIKQQGLIAAILKHPTHRVRLVLIEELAKFTQSDFAVLAKSSLTKLHTKLAGILLAGLKKSGFSHAESWLLKIDAQRAFKDSKQLNALITCLIKVISYGPYDDKESECLESWLLSIVTSKEKVFKELPAIKSLLDLVGKDELIARLQGNEKPLAIFTEKLQTLFEIDESCGIKDLLGQSQKTFEKFRNPLWLFTYLAKIKQLNQEEYRRVFPVFRRFVLSVLKEEFVKDRYDRELSPHLKKVFGKEQWKAGWLRRRPPEKVLVREKSDYTVLETDDPGDLLPIGTEVRSCLYVDGDYRINKCLVSYLMNGECLPIVVKEESGKLVARSMLRLMWDEQNQRPVILQEKIYSNNKNANIAAALNGWAIEKARGMGLFLVSKAVGAGPCYEGLVACQEVLAPFVYSDAADLGILDGKKGFEVSGCHILYDPTKIY